MSRGGFTQSTDAWVLVIVTKCPARELWRTRVSERGDRGITRGAYHFIYRHLMCRYLVTSKPRHDYPAGREAWVSSALAGFGL
jgi:hypothetical protein